MRIIELIQSIAEPLGFVLLLLLGVASILTSIQYFLTRRRVKIALRQLVTELYVYNIQDGCWDPIGSVDAQGMDTLVEVIARDRLSANSRVLSKQVYDEVRVVWK